MSDNNIRVFSGTACPKLAEQVANHLDMSLGRAVVDKFADGEANIEIKQNVRGREVFIVQSTCNPVNDNLMQLTIMADALRRASAASITAVVPYFGYARQDRRVRSARVPISAKVVADMMACVGIRRLITVDLHADQIQGFFSIPVDNVYASSPMLEDMYKLENHKELVVVSPDVGGVVRARAIAKRINSDTELAIIDKRRPEKNKAQVMNVIGDVRGRDCIMVDDIVDTAGTLCAAANALMGKGAKSVRAYVTHPVLSGQALKNITESALTELVVTDTIPLSAEAEACDKIRSISLSSLIAETISRITHKQSVSSMFE